jgi:hypothetical protein
MSPRAVSSGVAAALRQTEQPGVPVDRCSSQANALARGCDPLSFSCHAIAQATGFDLGSVATSRRAEVVVPMRRVQSAEPRSVPADRPSRQSALAQSGKHPVHGRRRPGGQPSAQAAPASSPAKKAVKTAPAPSAVATGGPPTTRSTRFRGAAVDVGSGTTQPPGPSHVPPLASSD